MSGLFKGIKKVFKKVGKVLKKIALPALAIGAVVLTGGAALGVLPSIGALGSSLGLSAGLTSVLSTAASTATMGAVGSALTGGNIIKGATTGFLTGAAMGGVGQLAGGLGGAQAAQAQQATGGSNAATATVGSQPWGVDVTTGAMPGWEAGTSGAVNTASSGAVSLGSAQASNGGIMGFLNRNPVVAGNLISGIGSGLIASSQERSARRAEERAAENYDTADSLYRQPNGAANDSNADGPEDGSPLAYTGGQYVFDRSTGRVRAVRGS